MKKPTPKFRGTPIKGVMSIKNISQWERYLNTLEGIECEITVTKYRKKRSLPQNAYYWGVVDIIDCEHGERLTNWDAKGWESIESFTETEEY